MNIFLVSDIHFEMRQDSDAIINCPEQTDVIVLAGDIHEMPSALEIVGRTSRKTGIPVIFVPGNHEYYDHDYIEMTDLALDYKAPNAHVLINQTAVIDNVRFLGTPLWTNFLSFGEKKQQKGMKIAERLVRDFHVIKHNKKPLTAKQMLSLYDEAHQFLSKALATPFDGKTIVVTHFPPSYKACHPWYQGDKINSYFNAAADDLILTYKPDAWFYGHTHARVDVEVHGVPLYTNPQGYPNEDPEITGFDRERLIMV